MYWSVLLQSFEMLLKENVASAEAEVKSAEDIFNALTRQLDSRLEDEHNDLKSTSDE